MGGIPGATSRIGNTRLIDHGIQNEDSHLRAHVCPMPQKVYVYPTQCGLNAISTGRYRLAAAHQPGVQVATAMGYLVPPFDIERCAGVSLRPAVWAAIQWKERSTYWKGRQATVLVMGMLKNGLFPIPALGTEITDRDLQIEGTDIIVRAGAIRQQDIVIQVKCDLPGGEPPGSGSLYLQTQECNPFSIH